MPDGNQDQPPGEKPLSSSEPTESPPWQADQTVEPEESKTGPQPMAGLRSAEEEFKPPVVEEVKEEPLGKEPVTETPSTEQKISQPETPSAETVPVGESQPKPTQDETLPPSGPSGPVRAFRAKNGSFKKVLSIVLGLALVAGVVFLAIKFGLPYLQESEEVTLTYWGLWEPDSVMQGVIADWNKDHPKVKINYSMQSIQQYRERLQSALARDEGPDIFRYHVTWTPMFKNELAPIPSGVMSASQFEATFYPVASTSLRSGTSYLGIPLEIDTLALFYNKSIFQAAGKTPPTTWDELRRLAIELTTLNEAGRIQIAGVALGTTNNVDHWSDILGLMMLQNEADLANPTDSLAEDVLTYYTIFSREDQVWDETLPNSTLAFANGKLAMYFGFSWDVFEIKHKNPDLEFGIVKAPQLEGTDISWASFWVEGVNSKGDYQEEAWEFLEYLSTQEVLTKLYQAESELRLFGEPYSRMDMADLAKANPLVTSFVDQASQAQTWYLCSRTFDNGINDRMIDYFKDAVNAVNLNRSSAQALETASSGVSQLLSHYGIATIMTR